MLFLTPRSSGIYLSSSDNNIPIFLQSPCVVPIQLRTKLAKLIRKKRSYVFWL